MQESKRKELTIDTRGQGWIRVFKEGKLILSIVYEHGEKKEEIANILHLIGEILMGVKKSVN